jgi:RimJ/RimL family protein N-acetyltransferase
MDAMSTQSAELVLDNKEVIGAWVAEQVGHGASWGDYYALGIRKGNRITAGIVINNYNGANATCHIAIKEFSKKLVSLFRATADYAFNHCKLKRLTGMVPTNEPHIIAFDKKVGFEEEFILKDGAPGADMMILVLWPDKCRWLQEE